MSDLIAFDHDTGGVSHALLAHQSLAPIIAVHIDTFLEVEIVHRAAVVAPQHGASEEDARAHRVLCVRVGGSSN